MVAFVYWKGLKIVANELRRYIQRNQIQLQQNLTAPQYACVVALLDAVIECLTILPTDPPE